MSRIGNQTFEEASCLSNLFILLSLILTCSTIYLTLIKIFVSIPEIQISIFYTNVIHYLLFVFIFIIFICHYLYLFHYLYEKIIKHSYMYIKPDEV